MSFSSVPGGRVATLTDCIDLPCRLRHGLPFDSFAVCRTSDARRALA
jgi:hypothetical protein